MKLSLVIFWKGLQEVEGEGLERGTGRARGMFGNRYRKGKWKDWKEVQKGEGEGLERSRRQGRV